MRLAMESTVRAALMVASLLAELEWTLGQRAPCYECEVYKDLHPRAMPYKIRSQCSYPCDCPAAEDPECPDQVPVITDGCGCCPMCARQHMDQCDGTALCDESRGLVCRYPGDGAPTGVCQVARDLPCSVQNRTYQNGETFLLDCRTQCSCQNGTYACASLCPQEYISPLGSCNHPRLVDVPGQCCREWMCDSATAQHPPDCEDDVSSSSWSACSSSCGAGLSHRVSHNNSLCPGANESRLCQVRACDNAGENAATSEGDKHHHVRKGHECKATQRASRPLRLRAGRCWSRKLYRPKLCGSCGGISSLCCEPQVSATLRVELLCEDGGSLPPASLPLPGAELWRRAALPRGRRLTPARVAVQWVIKCRCSEGCGDAPRGGPAPVNEDGETILHRVHRTAAP